MSNKQHIQKKNLKVSKNVLRKEVDKLRDNWINAGPGVPGAPPCGTQTSSALQFGVSRGLSELLLAPVGRVYLSEIVSEFGPKPGPRCRDGETRPLSLGEKRRTRRVDGVEGSTTRSDAVDAKIS